VSAKAKPLKRYGANINFLDVLLDIPILDKKGPVKIFWRVLHCCLEKQVIGRGYSKLGLHMEQ
jgi:hypothetical protein